MRLREEHRPARPILDDVPVLAAPVEQPPRVDLDAWRRRLLRNDLRAGVRMARAILDLSRCVRGRPENRQGGESGNSDERFIRHRHTLYLASQFLHRRSLSEMRFPLFGMMF